MQPWLAIVSHGDRTLAALVAVAGGTLLLSQVRKAGIRKRVDRWAHDNGLRLTRVEPRGFRRGPFGATLNDANKVYRVSAIRADGTAVQGWIQCRQRMTDRRQFDVKAIWDGEATA